jgi:hypothetical protein
MAIQPLSRTIEPAVLRGNGPLAPAVLRGNGPLAPAVLRGNGPLAPAVLRGNGPLAPAVLRGNGLLERPQPALHSLNGQRSWRRRVPAGPAAVPGGTQMWEALLAAIGDGAPAHVGAAR